MFRILDLEKEMLDVGIGKLGQKYWQMQGRTDCKDDGLDILEKAVEELKASKKEQQRVEDECNQHDVAGDVVETEDVRVELLEDDGEEEEEAGGGINDIDEDDEEVEDIHKVYIEAEDDEDNDDDDEEEEEDEEDKDDHISEDEEIEQHSHSPGKKEHEQEQEHQVDAEEVMDDGNEEPKWVHQQRVQESIEIYNRQRRMEKLKKEQGGGGGQSMDDLVATFSTTETTIDWNYETNRDGSGADTRDQKVYWTEWMDLKLAELVLSCVYDFASIADAFTELASSEEFTLLPPVTFGVGKHTPEILERLSEEDCRLRWAELDSKQWCDTDDGGNSTGSTTDNALDGNAAAPAVYKICVQPDVLGKGHGAQPTFAAMSNMATGLPSYLKVPTAFPSVSDDDEDEEEDAGGEEEDYTCSKFEQYEALD